MAFETLKDKLTTTPVLAFLNYAKPFILRVDASYHGLGAVLSQDSDGGIKVIGYGSRKLKPSESNYNTYKLEFLALLWAVKKKFHSYLYNSDSTIWTDHNPLQYIVKSAKPDATVHRWLQELGAYHLTIHCKPGKMNTDADALSRLPETMEITPDQFNSLVSGYTNNSHEDD